MPTKAYCHCTSYPEAHPAGTGKCNCCVESVTQYQSALGMGYRRWRPAVEGKWIPETKFYATDLCKGCGQPADTHSVDYGIGAYEFWGCPGVDVQWVEVTTCCDCDLVKNETFGR